MRRAVLILLGSLLGYAAIEGLIFHNLYASIIRPDSSAGNVETFIDNELRRARTDANQVLGIGDSRLQGALMPRVANQLRSETGYTFANISTAGSTPRCWYYMLRDVDPGANHYSAIMISVDSYDDAETWEDFADRQTDLHYLIARLRLSDLFEFSGSYHDPQRKWEAFRGILVKGLVYKQDFQNFLLHPRTRLAYVKLSRRDSVHWFYDYVGSGEDMQGVEVDFAARTLKMPPNRLSQHAVPRIRGWRCWWRTTLPCGAWCGAACWTWVMRYWKPRTASRPAKSWRARRASHCCSPTW